MVNRFYEISMFTSRFFSSKEFTFCRTAEGTWARSPARSEVRWRVSFLFRAAVIGESLEALAEELREGTST